MRRALLVPTVPVIAIGMALGSLTATTTAVVTSILDDKPAFAQGKGLGNPCTADKGNPLLHNPTCT